MLLNYFDFSLSESLEDISRSLVIYLITALSLTMYLHFLKTLENNKFHLFQKQNQSILLMDKLKENLLLVFHHHENLCDFTFIRCYFSFNIFSTAYRFTIKSFFNTIADFIPDSIILF